MTRTSYALYRMATLPVTASERNHPQSQVQKEYIMRTELKRWTITGRRWKRNEVSRGSPKIELNRQPTSLRKFKANVFSGPWVSIATVWKMKSHGMVEYFSFLLTVAVIIIIIIMTTTMMTMKMIMSRMTTTDRKWKCLQDTRRCSVESPLICVGKGTPFLADPLC